MLTKAVFIWLKKKIIKSINLKYYYNLKYSFILELKFSDNLLTPMSSKMFMSFFLQLKRN